MDIVTGPRAGAAGAAGGGRAWAVAVAVAVAVAASVVASVVAAGLPSNPAAAAAATATAATTAFRVPGAAALRGPATLAVPSGFPTSPPAAICDNPAQLTGPAAAPTGAVVVKAGDNSKVVWNRPGVTFWFAPGTHTLGTATGIVPANNTTFIGAPGAILDGKGINVYAFGMFATGVTIRYLTVQGFVPSRNTGAVNHETSASWTVQHNTIQNNQGAGVMVAPNNVVSFNCLRNNGQYGYSAFGKNGNTNITFDHNEVSGNNTANWEVTLPGCGCSGAGKIWNTAGGSITNNWIHNNMGPGIWVDTDNSALLIDGNYINDNDAEAIIYEISYNGRISNNNLLRNGFVEGRSFAATGSTFPVGAIYIAESGGDSRVAGGLYSTFEITGNSLDDNWGGITLWEDANRFCGADTTTTFCTLVNPQANLGTCAPGTIDNAPYFSDCRWKTQNLSVHDNQMIFSRADVGCATTGCGQSALVAGTGSAPSWSPYLGTGVDNAVTAAQNNHFTNNSYVGDIEYMDFTTNPLSLNAFQGAPYGQDSGSALTPLAAGNLLDADTANMEGSAGKWVTWFSSTPAPTTAQAHGGGHSLQVKVTAPYGWGIQLVNWPGFRAAPGPQTISFWGLKGTATGTGTGAATMTVDWRNPGGGVVGQNTITIPALAAQWQQALANVVAPAGTALATVEITGTTGVAGDSLFVDQVYVGTPPPSTNLVDPDSAGMEGSSGHWVAGTSSTVAQSSAAAQSGSHSLLVGVTAPGGWNVVLGSNTGAPAPGVAASPGSQAISFWGLQGTAGLTVTLTVDWRDGNGRVLRSDSVSLASLSTTWHEASTRVTAPAGTALATVGFAGSGPGGGSLYLDQVYVGAPVNLLDTDTSGLEGSVGKWVPWFSSTIAQSTAAAEAGTHSLQVDITAPFGWGVQLSNQPGFAAATGNQVISFWGLQATAPLGVTMTVDWRDTTGAVLQTDKVSIAVLSTTWQQASANVFAPAGTASVTVDFTNSSGVAGDSLYLDEVHVGS